MKYRKRETTPLLLLHVTRVPPFPSARCFMHLPQVAIHDGVLREMKLHGQFSQGIHGWLVPVVVIVKIERQSLCAKSPEVFLEKEVRQRAETMRDCPFKEGRQTKSPEGLQCGLVELSNCLRREAGKQPDKFLTVFFMRPEVPLRGVSWIAKGLTDLKIGHGATV